MLLIVGLIAAQWVPAKASPIEAEVIDGALTVVWDTEDWTTLDMDAIEADALDIFQDTDPGSACSRYAGTVWAYAHLLNVTFEADGAYTPAWEGAYTIFYGLDELHAACERL